MAAVPPGGQPSGPAAARRELTGPSWALEQRRGGQLPRLSRNGSIGLSHGSESWETWDVLGPTPNVGPRTHLETRLVSNHTGGDHLPKTLAVSVNVCRGEGVCCPLCPPRVLSSSLLILPSSLDKKTTFDEFPRGASSARPPRAYIERTSLQKARP